jgi:hypothetical protein
VGYRDAIEVGDACDYDFGLRLAADGGNFYFVDKYTTKCRMVDESVSRRVGNNAVISTYNLVAQVALPPSLERVRHDQLVRYAPMVVSDMLARGNRKGAWEVYTSAIYPVRQRLSLRGLLQAGLLSLPPSLARATLMACRRLRTR